MAPLPSMVADDLTHETTATENAQRGERYMPPDMVFGPVEPVSEVTVSGVVSRVWEDEILLRSFASSYVVDVWPQSAEDLGIRPGDRLRVTGLREEESLLAIEIVRQDGSVISIKSF